MMTSILALAFDDLRLALRIMLKRPSFMVALMLMIGLGTGVNAAVFGILHSVVFRPLPAIHPEQLVTMSQKASGGESIADLEDIRRQNHSFAQIEGYLYSTFAYRDQRGTDSVPGAQITPGYLAMLGVRPLLGRVLIPDLDQREDGHSVVISEDLWIKKFNRDARALGAQVNLDGEAYAVVGVMPRQMSLPYDDTQIWVPVPLNAPWRIKRSVHAIHLLARLKPTMTVKDAQAEMSLLTTRLAKLYPAEDGGRSVIMIGLLDAITSNVKPKLYLLMLAAIFIFLISTANIASVSLARASARTREIGIRRALGVSRIRLAYQLSLENLFLASLGSIVGWILASGLIRVTVAMEPADLPRLHEIQLDYSVFLLFAFMALLLVALLTMINFISFNRMNVKQALGWGGGGAIGDRRQWLGIGLVGIEIAAAVMLLIGTGLLVRSFQNLYLVQFGFVPKNRLIVHLDLPRQTRTLRSAQQTYQPICERLRSLPDVASVGFSNLLPLQGTFDTEYFIEGRTGEDAHNSGQARIVNEDYLKAMGMVLIRGRGLLGSDDERSPRVALINQQMARRWFPNEDPVGHRIRAFGTQDWMSIAGVVGDVRDGTIETDPPVEFFLPYRQNPYPPALWDVGFVVETREAPSAIWPEVRQAIHSANPEVIVSDFETLDDVISDTLRDRRLVLNLLAIFASLAVLLSTHGIYALLAYSVRLRTREIGVRMALGADRRSILEQTTIRGMRIVLPGLVAGTAGAYIVSRTLSTLLFEVKATDPGTFLLANALLGGTAFCAMLLPAWRASRIEPSDALRSE